MKKKILMISNSFYSLSLFRIELLTELNKEYEIFLFCPIDKKAGDKPEQFEAMNIHTKSMVMDRRSTDPFKELKLCREIKSYIKEIMPDIVITLTIKPNIYAGFACADLGIPYIANVTGLGTAFNTDNLLKKITVALYKRALRKCNMVFFENSENKRIMEECGILKGPSTVTTGAGVNLERFVKKPYPDKDNETYLFIGRLMKEKGIEEFLNSAERMKEKYPETRYIVVGFYEESYEERVKSLIEKGIIEYHSFTSRPEEYYEKCSALVQPSYHEGMSNVCLETAATGRPILVSDIPGCRETVLDGVSGFTFKSGSSENLYNAMERFHQLPYEDKIKMGEAGRVHMEKCFDRKEVVRTHMSVIKDIIG